MTDVARTFIETELAKLTKASSTPEARGYGVDLVCVEDLTPNLEETDPDSYESLGQDLFHRVTTPREGLPDDKDFGDDITAYLSKGCTEREIRSIEGRVALECSKDDRVDTVTCEITGGPSDYDVTIVVTPHDPAVVAFTLILSVTNGTALLEAIIKGGA